MRSMPPLTSVRIPKMIVFPKSGLLDLGTITYDLLDLYAFCPELGGK